MVVLAALSMTAVAERVGASSWLTLVRKAQMSDAFDQLVNFTAFVPTNRAVKASLAHCLSVTRVYAYTLSQIGVARLKIYITTTTPA